MQVLLVAGGWGGVSGVFGPLDSTEKLVIGAAAWTTVKPLPRKLYWVASINNDNQIFLFGKHGGLLVSSLLILQGGIVMDTGKKS